MGGLTVSHDTILVSNNFNTLLSTAKSIYLFLESEVINEYFHSAHCKSTCKTLIMSLMLSNIPVILFNIIVAHCAA